MNYIKGNKSLESLPIVIVMTILILAGLILAGCIQAGENFSGKDENANKAVTQNEKLKDETIKSNGIEIENKIEIENLGHKSTEEIPIVNSEAKSWGNTPTITAPLSQPLTVDSPKGQHNEESSFYAKGMRDYEGKILKVVIGKGYADSGGNYVINLKLYDDKGNLIDSREFGSGDTQSKFVNKDGDRLIATSFVVTEILKRVENGVDKYYAKIA